MIFVCMIEIPFFILKSDRIVETSAVALSNLGF